MSRIMQFIKSRPLTVAAVGAIAIVAGATAVSAQYGPPGWGSGWRGHGGGYERGHGRHGGFDRSARFCERDSARWAPVMRAWMKADLNLNSAQSGEFDKLADTLMPAMLALKAEFCTNLATSTAPAPERFEKLAALLRKAADSADKAVAPAKSFYGQLDDKQKARVEEMAARRGHHGRMGGRDRGDGPGQGTPGAPGAMPPR